ncbi:MAG: thiamine-phosphate kinase [Bdellovibrionales bacterium]
MHEFEMIRDYFRPLTMDRAEAGGLLDDAAVLDVPRDFDLCISSDTLNGGVHFLETETPENIAHKCLRVNLSDMAAMGAKPYCYQLNLAFSKMPDKEWAKAFTDALMADQKEFGVFCSGGDTTVIEGPMLVSMTITGLVPKNKAVKRFGAMPGDIVVVTGNIGDAAIGVKVKLGILELDDPSAFLLACDRPMPRTPISEAIHSYGKAGIDVSDGFIADLSHICDVSKVGAKVRLDKIPLSYAARHLLKQGVVNVEDLLTGGDDYEIALAIAPQNVDAFIAAAKERGVDAHAIGEFVSGEGVQVLDDEGTALEFSKKGWTHF